MTTPPHRITTQAALRVATGPGFQFAGVTDRVLRQVSRPLGR